MSFPSPSNYPPPTGPGAGSGHQQGYGPPPPPSGGYGPGPSAPDGYGYGSPGGDYDDRPYEGPVRGAPRARRGYRRRAVLLVLGVVVLLGLAVAGVVWLGSGYDTGGGAAKSGSSGAGAGSAADSPAAGGSPGGSPAPRKQAFLPYVKLAPGTCFDSPDLDTTSNVITTVDCGRPHDGETITDETLTGSFADENLLRTKALSLCRADAKHRLKSIPAGHRVYYAYALYPNLVAYRDKGENVVSCALTLSDNQDDRKLTRPLP